jgi:hypothetical protein
MAARGGVSLDVEWQGRSTLRRGWPLLIYAVLFWMVLREKPLTIAQAAWSPRFCVVADALDLMLNRAARLEGFERATPHTALMLLRVGEKDHDQDPQYD